jgi:hypothetical protein
MTGTSVDGLDIAICRIRTRPRCVPELVLGRTVTCRPTFAAA